MTVERRKRSRVPVQFDVFVQLAGGEYPVETVNLSMTGVLCATDPHFQNDLPCKVRIKLNDAFEVQLEGRILRVAGKETAIGFTAMDEQSFHHLKRIMELNIGDADEIDRELTFPAFK